MKGNPTIRIAILSSTPPTLQAAGSSWLCRTLQEYLLSKKTDAQVLYLAGKTRAEQQRPRNYAFRSYLFNSISPGLLKHILTTQYDIYLILEFGDLPVQLSALLLRFKSKIVFLIPLWHHDFVFRSRFRKALFHLKRNLLDYPIMRAVEAYIVSISEYERSVLSRFSKRIMMIPLGIDLNEDHWADCWRLASQKRATSAEIKVVTTGRLEPNKVPLYILRALDRVRRTGRPVKFHILATKVDDSYLRKFISEVKRSGLQDCVRIVDVSKMERSTVFSMIAQADVAVFPSYSESFGITVLESLYCGVPVIAARTGVAQYLESRNCLLAVDWGDVESMAQMILKACNMDQVTRDRLVGAAKDLVEAEFSKERFLESFWEQLERRYEDSHKQGV